jgi:hypothetical protein
MAFSHSDQYALENTSSFVNTERSDSVIKAHRQKNVELKQEVKEVLRELKQILNSEPSSFP